jgi:protein phosphatase
MSDLHEARTEEITPPRPQAAEQPCTSSALVQIDLAALSHEGRVRSNNEDHYLAARFGRSWETLLTNLPDGEVPAQAREVGYGMVVADGMGGHAAGEVASRLALRTLVNQVLLMPDWVMRPEEALTRQMLLRAVERFREVHAVLTEQAMRDPALQQMGTTMTLAWSLGDDLFIVHVGDSRAYLFRAGGLTQLTRDDTLAQSLVDDGEMTPQEAATSRLRHMLTQSLGGGASDLDVEIEHVKLADGDRLLLCTDGLTEMVEEPTIAEVLRTSPNAADACNRLVDLALDAGGKDNVTVVVCGYRLPEGTGAAAGASP